MPRPGRPGPSTPPQAQGPLPMARPNLPAWLIALALILPAGCGGEAMQSINVEGDSKKISEAVENFNEYSMDAPKTSKLFVADKVPKGDEFKKYRRFAYFPTGEAKVNGNDATMTVSLREEKTSKDVGMMDWNFRKDGGSWKIVAAPLP